MTITSKSESLIIFLLAMSIFLTCPPGSSSRVGEIGIRCKEVERRALLKIKEDLRELEEGVLSSWGEEEGKRECCEWIGVQCNNKSGHVTVLDLSLSTFGRDDWYSLLTGNISSSVVDLKYLHYLDLSTIDFSGNSIPNSIGSLKKLQYLDLSYTSLRGEIPRQFRNLSRLHFLALGDNYWNNLLISDLEWLPHLSTLRVLDISSTNLSIATDWVRIVNNLPFLTKLRLADCELPDIVPPSLSIVNSSKALSVLDLSGNLLSPSIFQWLFNYSHSLVHVDLSNTRLKGSIPEAFGNSMDALAYLDLSFSHLKGSIPKSFRNMNFLTYLALVGNELEGPIPGSFGNMSLIKVLDLSINHLDGLIPKSFPSMTSIVYLDVKSNRLKGSIPEAFGNMTRLEYLDLSENMLEGEIPKSIWEICSLKRFFAKENNLSGQIHLPKSSHRCSHFSLENLDLRWNRIVGPIPHFKRYRYLSELWLSSNHFDAVTESIGRLALLTVLDISENSINVTMSEAHFSNLANLNYLDLSSNSQLVLNIHSDWIPAFQLGSIYLGSCKLGPQFPKWLLTQKEYTELNISNSGISDSIPYRFWNLPTFLNSFDLSKNNISGLIPRDFPAGAWSTHLEIDLSSNRFEGSIPLSLLKFTALNLMRNKFSDLNSLCNATSSLSLTFLDVSYNQLSGKLPDCWSNLKNLQVLDLANNKLTGKIPSSIGFLTQVKTLHLSNNDFIMGLPTSLKNCTQLLVLDVGENNLSGPIPAWIGKNLRNLTILSLRSNNFYGNIPSHLCQLELLQLLDISSNDLSSRIPNCLGDLKAMKAIGSKFSKIRYPYNYSSNILSKFPLRYYIVKLFLVWKGAENEFEDLRLRKNIDLSGNKLIGEIPSEITRLVGLVSLNLSRNNLSGNIPQEIGQLKSLDALDLSRNHLFGPIPPSLSQVDRLNTLDLSNNNLSGKIPTGPQLQNRDPAAYSGNPELCGYPLLKKCPDDEQPNIFENGHEAEAKEDQDEFVGRGFYVSLGVGFFAGFWGFFGAIIFNKSWRYGYFKLLNDAGDWVFVQAAILKSKLLRITES